MSFEPHVALLVLSSALAIHLALKRFEKPPAHLASEWISKRWRRRTRIRLVVCALVSMVACVLVAWALAIHAPSKSSSGYYTRSRDPSRGEGEGRLSFELHVRQGSLYAALAARDFPVELRGSEADVDSWIVRTLYTSASAGPWPAPRELLDMRAWAIGWPFPCWWGQYRITSLPNGMIDTQRRGELQLPSWLHNVFFDRASSDPFIVPTLIYWPSFLANIILYTLVLYAPLTYLASRRLRKRFERGQCLRCGYDASGLAKGAPCPECGLASQTPANPVSSPA